MAQNPARAKIFHIDSKKLDEFALQLLRTPSYSTEESAVADIFKNELQTLGFQVQVDEIGNVIGTLELGEGPTVLLDSHLDTVAADAEKWAHSPWGEISNGRLYGRGAVDMKGPLAACLYGVSSLRDLTVGRILVVGSVAEEITEGTSLVRIAKQVKPDYVIICEPTDGRIAVGQLGRAEIRIDLQGRSAHSAFPDSGLNAAEAMADIVLAMREIERPTDPILGEGITVLTNIQSYPCSSTSVVPERCVATYDRRTLVGESGEDALAPVRTIVERVAQRWGVTADASIASDSYTAYTGKNVVTQNFAPAWHAGEDATHVSIAAGGLRNAGLEAEIIQYEFCTNGSGSAGELGIATIGYGPGEAGEAHTIDESLALADLHSGARGYAAIVSALLADWERR